MLSTSSPTPLLDFSKKRRHDIAILGRRKHVGVGEPFTMLAASYDRE